MLERLMLFGTVYILALGFPRFGIIAPGVSPELREPMIAAVPDHFAY
jgi:hypothetical protein